MFTYKADPSECVVVSAVLDKSDMAPSVVGMPLFRVVSVSAEQTFLAVSTEYISEEFVGIAISEFDKKHRTLAVAVQGIVNARTTLGANTIPTSRLFIGAGGDITDTKSGSCIGMLVEKNPTMARVLLAPTIMRPTLNAVAAVNNPEDLPSPTAQPVDWFAKIQARTCKQSLDLLETLERNNPLSTTLMLAMSQVGECEYTETQKLGELFTTNHANVRDLMRAYLGNNLSKSEVQDFIREDTPV